MAAFAVTSKMILLGAAWTGTGTEPGGTVAVASIAGTITTPSDISSFVHSGGEPGSSVNMNDATTFGSLGFTQVHPGLKSGDDLTFQIYGDYAAAQVHAIIKTTLGGLGSFVYVDIKPTNAARGATNPSSVFGAYISSYKSLVGSVGEMAGKELTLSITGTFTELIS